MGSTDICGLYRYVPQDGVGFLRFSILQWGTVFALVMNVFPALSLDMVPKLYQLKLQFENA